MSALGNPFPGDEFVRDFLGEVPSFRGEHDRLSVVENVIVLLRGRNRKKVHDGLVLSIAENTLALPLISHPREGKRFSTFIAKPEDGPQDALDVGQLFDALMLGVPSLLFNVPNFGICERARISPKDVDGLFNLSIPMPLRFEALLNALPF